MPQLVPNVLSILVLSTQPRGGADWTARLLEAFEAAPELAPTHWGPDERARSKYNRADAVAYAAKQEPQIRVPTLRRAALPTYLAYPFESVPTRPFGFKVSFPQGLRAEDVAPIYALGDVLAERMEAEFGFVHPAFVGEECRDYASTGQYKVTEFEDFGPRAVVARTWLGPHVAGLLGRERLSHLAAAGFDVEDMLWGGVRVDLVSPPWEADCATLAERQAQAMDLLCDSGVFGDYSHRWKRTLGPRWVPPPPVQTPPLESPAEPGLPLAVQRLKRAALVQQQADNVDIQCLDLKHIDLTGLNAPALRANGTHLDGALLTGARLVDAFFVEAHLDNAHLAGANLTMATFEGASMHNACLERTTLAFAFCNKADFTEADLTGANLEETGFADSRLDRAVLRNAKATRTVFNRASLVGADLRQGQFIDAAFRNADLTGADLSEGDFSRADFRGARLKGVSWQGAKLDGAQFDQENGTSH
jgi:uncharacterized protein YjbI with pentapeptide repeats